MNAFETPHIKRVGLCIGLLSAAVIAFQLILMQVFSITQWYHFAHMIISLALLGFGVSGTVLALFRKSLVKRFSTLFPLLLFLSAISMATVSGLVHTAPLRFDTYLLFNDFNHRTRLAGTCLLLMLPFFFAALAIGLSFVRYSGEIGRIYFANLAGSGIGSGVALGLMWVAGANQLPALVAILPFIAGVISQNRSLALKMAAGISLFVLILMNYYAPPLVRSPYKSIEKSLLLPEAKVIYQKSSPYGLVELVRSPALRYAPGLSLNYTRAIPPRDALFLNGDWLGAVIPAPGDSLTILSHTAAALPYVIRQIQKALVLSPGAGEYIAMARSYGVKRIEAAEPNRIITSLLKNELAPESDSLLFAPGTKIHGMEPRTFLSTTAGTYDLIQLPPIGSFSGTSGLDAFSIRNELTLEAFQEMWHKLDPDGMISVTCWMDYPVRKPLKVVATLSALMNSQGLREPENHLAAIRSWNALSFIVKRSEFTMAESRKIYDFCEEMSFDPLLLPGMEQVPREAYNELDDPSLFEAVDKLLSPEGETFAKSHAFRIEPATDDQPYFSRFIRLKSIPRLRELFGNRNVPYLELGYVVVLLTFLILFAASMILILLPVMTVGYKMAEKGRTFFYFGGIGLGYMFVEIALLQQFTLFLGQPVYSAAAVIGILLIASGLGSFFSARIRPVSKRMLLTCLAVAGTLLLYGPGLTPTLQSLMHLAPWLKFLLMIFIVGIPGVLMGIPFPLGLTRLGGTSPQSVPWAWAINGCASVTGAALSVILTVEVGFSMILFASALAYGIAAFSNQS